MQAKSWLVILPNSRYPPGSDHISHPKMGYGFVPWRVISFFLAYTYIVRIHKNHKSSRVVGCFGVYLVEYLFLLCLFCFLRFRYILFLMDKLFWSWLSAHFFTRVRDHIYPWFLGCHIPSSSFTICFSQGVRWKQPPVCYVHGACGGNCTCECVLLWWNLGGKDLRRVSTVQGLDSRGFVSDEQWKVWAPCCLGYTGDEQLPSYMGIVKNPL